jgi:cell division protein FtsQ
MAETKNVLLKDIERKKRRRSIIINTLAGIGAAALFTLLGFVSNSQSKAHCWSLEVKVKEQNHQFFVDTTSIRNAVLDVAPNLIGQEMGTIDMAAIYKKLDENPSIREAHVVTTVDGRCLIEVVQRNPIARIINADGSQFYLDTDGFTMPLSEHYTAKVPVFTGELLEKMQSGSVVELSKDSTWAYSSRLDDIYWFTKSIAANEFWSAMVEHVHFGNDGKMAIIPRVGNHRVVIGDISNLEMKMKKLMTFYANTIHTRDLNQYATISAEYDGQIVCVKRVGYMAQ